MITMRNFCIFVLKEEDALLGYTGENLFRRFAINVDEPGAWMYKLDLCNEAGAMNILNLTPNGNTMYADIDRSALQVSGKVTAQIRAIDGEKIKCRNTFQLFVGDSVVAVEYFDMIDPSEFEQLEASLTALKNEAAAEADRAARCIMMVRKGVRNG